MNNNRYVFFLIFLALSFMSCATYDQNLMVNNVHTAQTILLQKPHKKGHIHKISIQGRGHLDGKATFSLILNGKPYKIAASDGQINFAWDNMDWYSNTAEIQYQPVHVKSGTATIHFKFHD